MTAKPRIQAMIQDAVLAGFLPKQPLRLASPQLLKQPPPPASAPLMTKTERRLNCMFRRQPRQQTKRGSKQLEGCRSAASQTRQCQTSNTPAPPLKMKTVRTRISQHPGRADSVRRSSKRSFHG